MPLRNAPRKYGQRSVINITFFILLSIPFVIFGVLQENLDIRNRAFDDIEVSEDNPCIISLPFVNPYTLEVGNEVTLQVDAKLQSSGISSLTVKDNTGEVIHEEKFEKVPTEIATSFIYTPKTSGPINIEGSIEKAEGGSIACKISSPYDVKGLRAIPNNTSPEFTSKPEDSKPSQDIKTGIAYEYTLSALDSDQDRINYYYSFTPKADWLKATVIEDGSNGKLTIKFRGSTNKAASYLANVFIHDGYSKNIRSQSWIISVSPTENDLPNIKIITPVSGSRITTGEKLKMIWEASDLNHIDRYQLYASTNPTDEKTWKAINDGIKYNVTSYDIDTSTFKSGTYKFILRALDNMNPPGIGTAISPEVTISKSDDKPDNSVTMGEPQIVNMSPSSTDEITNPRPTVKATIISSKDASITESTIVYKLDSKDITKDIKINKISESEYTLLYQPKEDLTVGVHQAEISFKDSNNKDAQKGWSFTIKGEDKDEGNMLNIFGYEIAKHTLIIIGIGLIVVILAIFIPIMIAAVWREDRKKKEGDIETSSVIPISLPQEEYKYIEPEKSIDISDKVNPFIPAQPEVIETPNEITPTYTVAQPQVEQEEIQVKEPELPDQSALDEILKHIEEGKDNETNSTQ